MLVEFSRRFLKDLSKLNQVSVKSDVREIIEEIEKKSNQSEINNLKKLKGYPNAFRIRTGDYRIGILIENNIVEFITIAHRKDIYKIFP